jgi:hypothetical protein
MNARERPRASHSSEPVRACGERGGGGVRLDVLHVVCEGVLVGAPVRTRSRLSFARCAVRVDQLPSRAGQPRVRCAIETKRAS